MVKIRKRLLLSSLSVFNQLIPALIMRPESMTVNLANVFQETIPRIHLTNSNCG